MWGRRMRGGSSRALRRAGRGGETDRDGEEEGAEMGEGEEMEG